LALLKDEKSSVLRLKNLQNEANTMNQIQKNEISFLKKSLNESLSKITSNEKFHESKEIAAKNLIESLHTKIRDNEINVS
jgi:hypothetical protein